MIKRKVKSLALFRLKTNGRTCHKKYGKLVSCQDC